MPYLRWITSKIIQYKKVIFLILAVKVLVLVAVFGFKNILPTQDPARQGNYFYRSANNLFERSLATYDSQYYIKIAEDGYLNGPMNNKLYAFYPLYPILIKIFSPVFLHDSFLTGIFISFICSFFAIIFLYKLLRLDSEEKTAILTVFYYLIFPAAIFYCAIYTESLFFLLSVLAFYFARERKWLLVGLFGFLAALTKAQGVLLVVPLAIEYLMSDEGKLNWSNARTKLNNNDLGLVLLIPAGLLSFFIYSFLTKGSFFLPLQVQGIWYRKPMGIGNFVNVLDRGLFHFNTLPFHNYRLSMLDFLFSIIFLLLLIPMVKKIRLSYIIYSFLLIFVPLSTGTTASMIRYLSVSFPHFLFLAQVGEKSKTINAIIILIFVSLLLYMGIRFVDWHWAE